MCVRLAPGLPNTQLSSWKKKVAKEELIMKRNPRACRGFLFVFAIGICRDSFFDYRVAHVADFFLFLLLTHVLIISLDRGEIDSYNKHNNFAK